jgi:pSer/pThr/pTyr-binding forkhead associated (FHA) protein
MAKLIFSLDNAILNEFPLENERTTIGRRPTNDIQIDNLAVSGEHAVILKMGDDFYIEDQDSTNGTEVNAKLVKSHLLQPGDLIVFGKHQLKFINEAKLKGQSGGDSAFEKTVLMQPNEVREMMQAPAHSQATPIETISVRPPSEPEVETVAKLFDTEVPPPIATGRIQVLNGSSVGRELVLNKALTTLGKTGVQVAVITKRPRGYFITHVEGKVFPNVNGNSTGAQAFELSDHDVIELAGVKMEFYLDKV